MYNAVPIIRAIQPDSAASRAGIQVGDKVLEINGKKIPNYSTLQHVLGPMYEGDEIAVKVMRGDKERVQERQSCTVRPRPTSMRSSRIASCGTIPAGVEIRYVYPKSPADVAGLKAGDRVMKFGPASQPAPTPIQNRAAFLAAMQRLTPGIEVKVEVKRKEREGEKDVEKTLTLNAKLLAAPAEIPEKLPLPSSAGKALEGQPKKKDPKDPFPPPEESAAEPTCGQDKKDDAKKTTSRKSKRDSSSE